MDLLFYNLAGRYDKDCQNVISNCQHQKSLGQNGDISLPHYTSLTGHHLFPVPTSGKSGHFTFVDLSKSIIKCSQPVRSHGILLGFLVYA